MKRIIYNWLIAKAQMYQDAAEFYSSNPPGTHGWEVSKICLEWAKIYMTLSRAFVKS